MPKQEPGFWDFGQLLRIPAFYKILIANSILILVGSTAGLWVASHHNRPLPTGAFLLAVVIAGVLINSLLIRLALEPFKELQRRAQWHARHVIAAQEAERKRIARELHDETSQLLASLILGLEKVKIGMPELSPQCLTCKEDVGALKGLTDKALVELHRLAFNLRPSLLDDMGLKQALSQLLREQVEQRGISLGFYWEGPEERFPEEIEIALFRIIQEAVTNAVKYARARKISVFLRRDRGLVNVEIADDGIGFDSESILENNDLGLGLKGMEERASLLQGSFDLYSQAGKGTRVTAHLPVQLNQDFLNFKETVKVLTRAR